MRTSNLKNLPWQVLCLVLLTASTAIADDRDSQSISEERLQAILSGDVPRGVEELKAIQTRVHHLVEQVTPSIVAVEVDGAQGSGVVISKDGYVLTAGHVSGRAKRNAVITFPDGRKVRGKTLGLNFELDSGLIKITEKGRWPYVEMGQSNLLKKGQWVVAAGHPGGFVDDRAPVIRLGRILSHNELVVRTDCTLVGGDSGGPLFDMDGRVVGINSRIGGKLTANLHVPINTYGETWDQLVAGKVLGSLPLGLIRPYVGLTFDKEADNAKITEVAPGGPGEKAGFQPGDVVIKFGRHSITDFRSLVTQVQSSRPGQRVDVVVQRGDDSLQLEIEIGFRYTN